MENLVTQITNGVKVSVRTLFQTEYSQPAQHHYVFTYSVTIENMSNYTIQLLNRHWLIYDTDNIFPVEVSGEGVVGQQPVLEPGESYNYVSGCNLKSEIGKMEGRYEMRRAVDGKIFFVDIPEFAMMVPYRLN